MNSAKNSEDEMRHKLLQISSRGVQIPCNSRYLNSFRGVCGSLSRCVSEATLVFDLALTSVVQQTWVETLSESHHTASVEPWPGGRGIDQCPQYIASRENHAVRAGRLSAKVARSHQDGKVIDTLHFDPLAASPLSLVNVEGTRHLTRGTERRPITRDIRSGRDHETPPSNGGLVAQQSKLGQGPGPAS